MACYQQIGPISLTIFQGEEKRLTTKPQDAGRKFQK